MFSVALAADVRVQINSTHEPSSHLLSATAPSVLHWRIGTFLSVPKGLCLFRVLLRQQNGFEGKVGFRLLVNRHCRSTVLVQYQSLDRMCWVGIVFAPQWYY